MVEQLVEVPTIISYSSLQPTLFGEAFKAFLKDKVQKRVVEQPVDFPVPGGGGPSSGLQGFSSGQSSTAVPSFERIPERFVEQIVDLSSEERISERIVETSAFPSSKKRSSERILEQITVPASEERSSQRIVEQLVDISSGGLSPGVFSASSAGAADEGPAGRGSGMGKARFAGEVAPRGSSSRGKVLLVTMPLVFFLLVARLVLLVTMHLVLCLLAARQVLLVKMPLVVLLLAARVVPASPRTLWISFSSSTASSSRQVGVPRTWHRQADPAFLGR